MESGNSEGENSALITNEGWADSVAKILGSNKPKNKKTLVLSRAKKYKEPVKEVKEDKPSFEVIGDGDEKKDIKVEVKQESDPAAPLVKKKVGNCSVKYLHNKLHSRHLFHSKKQIHC